MLNTKEMKIVSVFVWIALLTLVTFSHDLLEINGQETRLQEGVQAPKSKHHSD